MKKLNVVFTIDDRFIQHMSVTIASLLENNKDLVVKIFIIHDIKDDSALKVVGDYFSNRYRTDVKIIYFENALLDSFKVSLHYSKTVYYRLLITEILPKDIDEVLFLDSDIVVTGSLEELAKFKFDEQYLLAVHDVSLDNNMERLQNLGFPLKKYFNAGVLYLNLKKWRDEDIASKLLTLAEEYMDRIAWWDQDILNMYLYDKWQPIDRKYNALLLKKRLKELPLIIHYGGPEKPWLYVQDHPYKSLYWKYIKFTPFKNATYPDYNFKEFLRKRYITLLNVFGLRKVR